MAHAGHPWGGRYRSLVQAVATRWTLALGCVAGCGHAGSAPPVPLHKGYTAFDSQPESPVPTTTPTVAAPTTTPTVAAPSPPPAAPAVPTLAPGANKLVPVPPIAEPPPSAAPVARAQIRYEPRYEPPMPLTVVAPPEPPPARPAPRSVGMETSTYSVQGVDRSDVLYVRAAPGSQSPVIGEIAPDTSGIVGMAGRQKIGPSTWREVKYGNVRGWVNARFLVEERDVGPSRSR